ncbi:MAG: hypothetical protein II939_14755 [Bacteroidales bacterium]|nr:hypothetical protein [Bacteroidales bacterium]
MKRRIIFLMAVMAMFVLPQSTKAQILSRGGWELHPNISFTNPVYGLSTSMLYAGYTSDAANGYSTVGYRFIPAYQQKYRLQQKIETPDGSAKVKWWDWQLRSFSVGYTFGYLSFTNPFGFVVELNYEKQNWNAKLPKNDDYINFAKTMFAPELCLRLRLGSREGNVNFILEPGAKYNYALNAHGEYNGNDHVNNGVTGIFGIGYYNKVAHLIGSIRYEKDFFDYFNQDFVAPDGSKPYNGFKTKHGLLNISLGLCF